MLVQIQEAYDADCFLLVQIQEGKEKAIRIASYTAVDRLNAQ
tara:strand:+ start:112 stop:237 length:126 start_codon:yes stop_codon:yes gene_type:complete